MKLKNHNSVKLVHGIIMNKILLIYFKRVINFVVL